VKLWKVAISLAVVGAVGAPFVLGTWKAMPRKEVWIPLTEQRRQEIENYLKEVNYCKDRSEGDRFACEWFTIKPLEEGREFVGMQPNLLKYLAFNLAVTLPVFVGIFCLAMVIPLIALRYWRWLRT
jgi:hypothetical protein